MKFKPRWIIKLVILFIFLLALFGCYKLGIPSGEHEEEPLVLKSYEVPEGYGHELVRIINNLLVDQVGKKRYGQVTMTSDGLLLVNAPQSFHPGVSSFLADLKNREPLPPEPSIKAQYWIVLGKKIDGESNSAEFKEIAPALQTINESQGPHQFVLQECLSTMSQSGQSVEVTGATASIHCQSSIREDVVLMNLRIRSEGSSIDTNVQIPEGKLLVLGQSAHEPKRPYAFLEKFSTGGKSSDTSRRLFLNIFYIVRADVIS